VLEELINCQTDIARNLTKQNRRDVSSVMKGDGCRPVRAVAKLFMRTALPNLNEAQLQQYCDNFGRFENGNVAHELRNGYVLDANEFRLKLWLTVFQQHDDDFAKILVKLIQCGALRVGASEPWDEPHKQTRPPITFDDGRVCFHRRIVARHSEIIIRLSTSKRNSLGPTP
jgi:hypothetical protein